MTLHLATHGRVRGVLQTVVLGDTHLLHLLATADQLDQLALGCAGSWRGRWLQALTELSQHLRIEPIGFGQTTLSASKVAGLARVDDTNGDGRLLQRHDHRACITAAGFTHDVYGAETLEPTHERTVAGGDVGWHGKGNDATYNPTEC